MDLIKIGKFIANCRKDKNLTQEQLAEKLYVTDRAVSKWERGLSLPDAGKMLDLCGILEINVNELLTGEKIDMENMNKKSEELLVEMTRQEQLKNKKLITSMYIMTGSAVIFYIGIIGLASLTLKEGPLFGAIICAATALLVFIAFYGLKLEVDAGYYECAKCHHKFTPKNYFVAMFAPHLNTTRYLKCPECNKRSWAKKVMSKD
jgi:transcriptional regulator with XRE-family HTH domain/DNA-directed RNA polymerase subunit RPC12/RpoP